LWSYVANKTGELFPEARAFAFEAHLEAIVANVLARKSSANNIEWPIAIFIQLFCGKSINIPIDFNSRKVFSQYLSTERINFAERYGSHSRPFQTKAKAAYAAKKIENAHYRSYFVSVPPVAAPASARFPVPTALLPSMIAHSGRHLWESNPPK
jgi:hypothetical protein